MTVQARSAGSALADASDALEGAYREGRAKPGKGAEHGREVAAILRAAGCPESVQVVGLLHDVVEDTAWTIEDIAARFGPGVARVIGVLTEDDGIDSYRRRKRALREQIAAEGAPATDVAVADKIASLRYLRLTGRRLPKRKRAHYEASLAGAAATARASLTRELAGLLDALAERDSHA
jgi:(p)ppGpp synthase/HD superfamily hydrolase